MSDRKARDSRAGRSRPEHARSAGADLPLPDDGKPPADRENNDGEPQPIKGVKAGAHDEVRGGGAPRYGRDSDPADPGGVRAAAEDPDPDARDRHRRR